MKFGNGIAASVGYKHIIAIVLLVLHAPLFAAPVTFDASGDWSQTPPADIPPFATSYTASITFDNGGTSALNQVFTEADFVSFQVISGTVDRTYYSSATITWYADFTSDASGVLNDGYAYLQTGSNDSFINLSHPDVIPLYDGFDLRLSPSTTQDYASAYGVTFTNDEVPPATYSVGGTVSGLTGSVTLQNNGGDDIIKTTNDGFTFPAQADSSAYAVTVSSQPTGQTCSVTGGDNNNIGSGTIAGADVTNVAVTCVTDVVPTYSVGGTVSGLTGTGLALQNNGGDTLAVAAAATDFTFVTELEDDVAYAVTVSTQPTGQTCEVTSGSGTIAAADVTNVAVDCVDDVVIPPTPATPVPTLSQWALIMLSMFLGLMVFANRRRLF